jgi:hypothetical protein
MPRFRFFRPAPRGYCRLHVLRRPEGAVLNHKELRRLYREERLARRRLGRKRAPAPGRADGDPARAKPALERSPDLLSDAFWLSTSSRTDRCQEFVHLDLKVNALTRKRLC